MNNKLFQWMLLTVLCFGLSTSFIACSDDDDNNDGRTAEERAQDPYDKESDGGRLLYRLVSQLSVADSLPDNWREATFEPAIGQVLDQSQPMVRTITVSDAAEAVSRYNSLTGRRLEATATSDTYKAEGVGTVSLAVGNEGTVATIDFNVKQMPKLTRLRMVTTGSLGENGSFKGEAYYRFGDVVKDKDNCYWVCVRPPYSPNGKGDSHWMTLQLTPSNIKEYTKKNIKQTYPVSLGVNEEKMNSFVQLLLALSLPERAVEFHEDYGEQLNGKYLGKLDYEAFTEQDIKNVALLYEQLNLWDSIAPKGLTTPEQIAAFRSKINNGPFRLIYEKGYTKSNLLKIPVAIYTTPATMYTQYEYKEYEVNMSEMSFDVNTYALTGKKNDPACSVPDAYVVRYKTGKQLSSNWFFNPDPTKPLEGVQEVFCYNKNKVRTSFYRMGDIYQDDQGSRWICVWLSCNQYADNSDYTYFASFDNIKYTSDKSRATNLAPRDDAMRAAYSLRLWAHQAYMTGKNSQFKAPADNVKENCGVDLGKCFIQHWDGKDGRSNWTNACIAYDGGSANGQDLLRYVSNAVDYEYNNDHVDVWQHYPADFPEEGRPKSFTNTPILLQDIANQDKVNQYANESITKRPMSWPEQTKIPSPIRTQADPRANDVTNYFYDAETFNAGNNPMSMWNEPVLFFRVAKVLDKGEKDYETTTTDGRKLTLLKTCKWTNSLGVDAWGQFKDVVLRTYSELANFYHVDGANETKLNK